MAQLSPNEIATAPASTDIDRSLFANVLALLRQVPSQEAIIAGAQARQSLLELSTPNPSPNEAIKDVANATNLNVFTKNLMFIEERISDGSADSFSEEKILVAIAACLDIALGEMLRQAEEIVGILADASRQPRWRLPFGKLHGQANLPNPDGLEASPIADSVLGVGLKIVSKKYDNIGKDLIKNALRLIANCCADTNQNRKVVLDQSGITSMMNLAHTQTEPDFLVVALFNVCYNYEPPQDNEPVAENTQILPNNKQYSLDPAQVQLGMPVGEDGRSAIQTLVDLVPVMAHEDRMPILSDLVEMASLSVLEGGLPSIGVDEHLDKESQVRIVEDLLRCVISLPGVRLATYNESCRISICNAFINLLSQDLAKEVLISHDLVVTFVNIVFRKLPDDDSDVEEDSDIEADLSKCRSATLRIFYDICALPEFTAKYTTKSSVVESCVKALRSPSGLLTSSGSPSFPLAFSCVLLASIVVSEEAADFLVQDYHVHDSLSEVLLRSKDMEVLYPAVNMLGRLARSSANKKILIECGMLEALDRFFQMDTNPAIQREAVISVRRLMAGSPHTLFWIRGRHRTHDDEHAGTNLLDSLLDLFKRTDDRSIRLEIGRLMIEVCRILWNSVDNRPGDAGEGLVSLAGSGAITIATPIAWVARNGEGQGARGEGWFGLAMMTLWDQGRRLVVLSLEDSEMQEEMNKVVASGDGPSFQNLRLLLAKLHLVQSGAVTPQTRTVLEAAARQLGLDEIWPEDTE